jgi:hypothetical protein
MSMFAPNPPIKVEFKNPKTKTSNLGKSRYTTYVRPDDIMSSKQLLKNTSPRLKSTLEYIEKNQKRRGLSTLEPINVSTDRIRNSIVPTTNLPEI